MSCPDKPFNGLYFFENRSAAGANDSLPIFQAPRRVGKGIQDAQVSYVKRPPARPVAGYEYPDFLQPASQSPSNCRLPKTFIHIKSAEISGDTSTMMATER